LNVIYPIATILSLAVVFWMTGGVSARSGKITQQDTGRRIGIIVQGPPVKGIFRDAECLVWALTTQLSRSTRVQASISIFYTYNYVLLDQVITSDDSRHLCVFESPDASFSG
jgi:hypothetical protein